MNKQQMNKQQMNIMNVNAHKEYLTEDIEKAGTIEEWKHKVVGELAMAIARQMWINGLIQIKDTKTEKGIYVEVQALVVDPRPKPKVQMPKPQKIIIPGGK